MTAIAGSWRWLTASPDQPHTHAHAHAKPAQATAVARPEHSRRRGLLIGLIILASSTASIAIITFTPILFSERGYSPTLVGWLSGLLMMGSAVGGLVGGTLGDRIQGKWVILLGLTGSILPLYFFVPAPVVLQAILLLLAGFFGGMPHTILVLTVQSLLPKQRAMASGLTLGFMFFSGAVGSYFVGFIADNIGLATTLQRLALLPFIAILVAVWLPRQVQNQVKKE